MKETVTVTSTWWPTPTWRVRPWSRTPPQSGSSLGANTRAGACTGQAAAVSTRRRRPPWPSRPPGGKGALSGVRVRVWPREHRCLGRLLSCHIVGKQGLRSGNVAGVLGPPHRCLALQDGRSEGTDEQRGSTCCLTCRRQRRGQGEAIRVVSLRQVSETAIAQLMNPFPASEI